MQAPQSMQTLLSMYSIWSSAWKHATGHTVTQSVKRHLSQLPVTMVGMSLLCPAKMRPSAHMAMRDDTNRRKGVRTMRAVQSWTTISRRVCLTATAMEPFLIAAVTGRALAASAARSGLPVVVLDCFADRDTRALARRCRSVVARQGLRFDARALLAAAAELAPSGRCAGLVCGSGFEGRTGLLGRLARGRRLYGGEPSVVAAVKDARRFLPLLDRLGISYPETRFTAPEPPPARPAPSAL